MVMSHKHAVIEVRGQSETNGRTDTTDRITFPDNAVRKYDGFDQF